ncbi:substrate-binding periplasmic protein [Vibrio atypicus]|uniref:substrate-binding periplasmic protein n=1 Tax=Vibrio atypicus TaxID=558271 RepID=UPI0037353D7A
MTHSLLLALTFLLFSQTTLAAKEIKVGVDTFDYFPLHSFDAKSEQYKGYARELLDLFSEKYGYTFTYVPLPRSRMYKMYFSQQIDAVFPDNPKWSFDQKIDKPVLYTSPVNYLREVMFVHQEKKAMQFNDLKKLGVIQGTLPWKLSPAIDSGRIQVIEAQDPYTLLDLVEKGRIDGAVLDLDIGRSLLYVLKLDLTITFNVNILKTQAETYHLSTILKPELIDQFEEFSVKYQYEINELKYKYDIMLY